ncbi:hypothetical protein GQ457_14G016860 [Hibiscus cannabinus]
MDKKKLFVWVSPEGIPLLAWSDPGLTGFTSLEGYFDNVGSIMEGKPIWEVRRKNWKLRGGEDRLSGLL